MAIDENLQTRAALVMALRAEVIGPDPQGEVLATIPAVITTEERGKLIPSRQPNGQEVLMLDSPLRRYASAILHPRSIIEVDQDVSDNTTTSASEDLHAIPVDESTAGFTGPDQAAVSRPDTRRRRIDPDTDDFGIAAANGFKPSAMGMSFVVDVNRLKSPIQIKAAGKSRVSRIDSGILTECGFYQKIKIKITESGGNNVKENEWWIRKAFLDESGNHPLVEIKPEEVLAGNLSPYEISGHGFPGKIQIRATVRSWPGAPQGHRLITVSMANVTECQASTGVDSFSLFQAGVIVFVPPGALCSYPESQLDDLGTNGTVDDASIVKLAYSRRRVFAVGHGCSADWEIHEDNTASELWTDFMPSYEMSPMAFDIKKQDGTKLKLPMRFFANSKKDQIIETLTELIDLYSNWIAQTADAVAILPDVHRNAGMEVVSRCGEAIDRMKRGLELLTENDSAYKAFQLANKAMLMAQHRKPAEPREPVFANNGAEWPKNYNPLDLDSIEIVSAENDEKRPVGQWRPFQLAFLLMSIESIADENDCEDRNIVDLIWFPTGGGKTEAYLALAAFTVLFNALSKRVATGIEGPKSVSILMRYTLRLLTAQQFQRATALFCALELIRIRDVEALGNRRFEVGLWVGSSSTPNDVKTATRALKVMKSPLLANRSEGENPDANPFILLQCPWCSALFGRVHALPERKYEVHGYRMTPRQSREFRFICPDRNCEFGPGSDIAIPAVVVDEDLYSNPPTLLIGTVDKFAMLAWKPEVRRFFGIGDDGRRAAKSPDLIIQDELHLMTGPLGTMVGLYETAIDALCAHDGGSLPKYVASTATAARAAEQVGALYGGRKMQVFPPSGIDASDSFFAREETNAPGRIYVGVLAPGHGSMQTTQTRTFATLLQKTADVAAGADVSEAPELADPWWTMLCYFNSLRELGGTLTLFGADIPEYLRVMHRRNATSRSAKRWIGHESIMELTSRLKSEEVPAALRTLEKKLSTESPFRNYRDGERAVYPPYGIVDACLASNIVEVGVDVPRLSLMTIVGQPKTTSSYIQASSRVGRRDDRPGLVVMLYSTTKPRDRSHYERFRQYHQSIYAWVEPTSVTPFSPPAVERALHGVMASIARQTCSLRSNPQEALNTNLINQMENIFNDRAALVVSNRPDERINLEKMFKTRINQWEKFESQDWGSPFRPNSERIGLMYPSGQSAPLTWKKCGWPTPTSLRDVDGTCEAEVTGFYTNSVGGELE